MTTFSIRLTSVSDVKLFVEAASRCRCEVDILTGRYVVDGKSILGLLSINLAAPVTVRVCGTEQEAAALKADAAAFVAE